MNIATGSPGEWLLSQCACQCLYMTLRFANDSVMVITSVMIVVWFDAIVMYRLMCTVQDQT